MERYSFVACLMLVRYVQWVHRHPGLCLYVIKYSGRTCEFLYTMNSGCSTAPPSATVSARTEASRGRPSSSRPGSEVYMR